MMGEARCEFQNLCQSDALMNRSAGILLLVWEVGIILKHDLRFPRAWIQIYSLKHRAWSDWNPSRLLERSDAADMRDLGLNLCRRSCFLLGLSIAARVA